MEPGSEISSLRAENLLLYVYVFYTFAERSHAPTPAAAPPPHPRGRHPPGHPRRHALCVCVPVARPQRPPIDPKAPWRGAVRRAVPPPGRAALRTFREGCTHPSAT